MALGNNEPMKNTKIKKENKQDNDTCKVVLKKVEEKAATLLGKNVDYRSEYNPDILVPFSRKDSLLSCNIDMNEYLYYGFDLWNMWEVRYKLNNGKSLQRIGQLIYEAHSPFLIESKSMKLYFFGQMFDKMGDTENEADKNFVDRVTKDLNEKTGVMVDFKVQTIKEYFSGLSDANSFDPIDDYIEVIRNAYDLFNKGYEVKFTILDDVKIPEDFKFHKPVSDNEINYDNPDLIKVEPRDEILLEEFVYYGGKSNCLVTGQPDFCTELIVVKGKVKVDELSLLDYLQTFESVNRFHESTAHSIFDRLVKKVKAIDPKASVTVFSLYTRRGGIDINPFRTTERKIYDAMYNFVRNTSWLKSWNQ